LWAKDPHAFSLPATHIFWTNSGKKPPTGGGRGTIAPATAAQSATTGSIESATSLINAYVGLLIAQYKTRSEDGQFASFLPLKNQFGIWQYKFALQIKLIFIISNLFANFSI
jgi:hypothetical protein